MSQVLTPHVITHKLMIKHFMLGAVALYALASCTAESPIDTQLPHPLTAQNVASPTSFDYDPAHFATPDTKSENLTYLGTVNGTPAANKILLAMDPKVALTLSDYPELTTKQFEEIKAKTTEITQGAKNQTEALRRIHDYLTKNIQYDKEGKGAELAGSQDANSPYLVFSNKLCVCQGYANLLRVMAISQGIPSVSLNGNLFGGKGTYYYGGHAWAAALADGKWVIEDPTNGNFYPLNPADAYAADLQTTWISPAVFEKDGFVLDFHEVHLNVAEVKSQDPILTVPYSYEYDAKRHKSFRITSFNPHKMLPDAVKQIYLGDNIVSLGQGLVGLSRFGNQVEAVHVSPNNKKLCSEDGAVYRCHPKNKERVIDELIYVPTQKKSLKLLPLPRLEKNTVVGCAELEEVYILPGTKVLEAYAFERCPKLRKVYLPEDCKVEEGAFAERSKEVELVRGDFTGIRRVRR